MMRNARVTRWKTTRSSPRWRADSTGTPGGCVQPLDGDLNYPAARPITAVLPLPTPALDSEASPSEPLTTDP